MSEDTPTTAEEREERKRIDKHNIGAPTTTLCAASSRTWSGWRLACMPSTQHTKATKLPWLTSWRGSRHMASMWVIHAPTKKPLKLPSRWQFRQDMRYSKPQEGEWIQPIRSGYKFMCCDCGLVHRMDFRLVSWSSGRKIQFRAFRDNRATAAVRRERRRAAAQH